VWVKPEGKAWRGRVRKVLPGLGEEIIVVFLGRGKVKREARVLLSQTRPLREARGKDGES